MNGDSESDPILDESDSANFTLRSRENYYDKFSPEKLGSGENKIAQTKEDVKFSKTQLQYYQGKKLFSDSAVSSLVKNLRLVKRDTKSKNGLQNLDHRNANKEISIRYCELLCEYGPLQQIKGKGSRQTK